MLFKSKHVAVAAIVLPFAHVALATIKVEFKGPGDAGFTTAANASVGSGNTVSIDPVADRLAGIYRVYSTDPNNENIGVITFGGSTGAFTLLLGANAVATDPLSELDVGCKIWEGLDPGSLRITVQASIHGNLAGPVVADHIVRLDVDGNILVAANVTQTPFDTASPPELTAITAGGYIASKIRAIHGSINLVNCGGNLNDTGEVTAENGWNISSVVCNDLRGKIRTKGVDSTTGFGGNILSVRVFGDMPNNSLIVSEQGSIGSVIISGAMTDESEFGQDRIQAMTGVGSVKAASMSFTTTYKDGGCRIIANRTPRPAFLLTDGILGRLETTGDCKSTVQAYGLGTLSGNGVFIAGNLNAEIGFSDVSETERSPAITSPIHISGNMNGPITSDGALDSTGSIVIGGSLNNIITIRQGQPILGQIIINANNNGGVWGANGRVQKRDTPTHVSLDLTNETYTQKSSELGDGTVGGSVGVVPFKLHDSDCLPINNAPILEARLQSQFMATNQTTVPVEVEFYGPVEAGASPPIVRVYHHVGQDPYPDGAIFDVTHRCDISFVNGRTVSIKGKSGYFFLPTDQTSDPSNYVVVNATSGTTLVSPLCDNVAGNPPASAFQYTFELRSDCDADGNADTVMDQCAKTG